MSCLLQSQEVRGRVPTWQVWGLMGPQPPPCPGHFVWTLVQVQPIVQGLDQRRDMPFWAATCKDRSPLRFFAPLSLAGLGWVDPKACRPSLGFVLGTWRFSDK